MALYYCNWVYFARWLSKTGALVAMKTSRSKLNVEDDLIYALPCFEPRISLLSNKQAQPSIDCSARVIKCCFYFCTMHVQQLSRWTPCLLIGPRAWKAENPCSKTILAADSSYHSIWALPIERNFCADNSAILSTKQE